MTVEWFVTDRSLATMILERLGPGLDSTPGSTISTLQPPLHPAIATGTFSPL